MELTKIFDENTLEYAENEKVSKNEEKKQK